MFLGRTFVIFSMFLTDLRRSSISRRVAMFLAPDGAAPTAAGNVAVRASERRASIVDILIETAYRTFGHGRRTKFLSRAIEVESEMSARCPTISLFSANPHHKQIWPPQNRYLTHL